MTSKRRQGLTLLSYGLTLRLEGLKNYNYGLRLNLLMKYLQYCASFGPRFHLFCTFLSNLRYSLRSLGLIIGNSRLGVYHDNLDSRYRLRDPLHLRKDRVFDHALSMHPSRITPRIGLPKGIGPNYCFQNKYLIIPTVVLPLIISPNPN